MTTDILQAKLNLEAANRNLAQAVRESEEAEAQCLVAAIHAAYEPYAKKVQTLLLAGIGLCPPVRISERDPGRPVQVADGLDLLIGSRVSPNQIKLTVTPREGAMPPKVQLLTRSKEGAARWDIESFPADTSAQQLISRFFDLLMPHLHEDNFKVPQAAKASDANAPAWCDCAS